MTLFSYTETQKQVGVGKIASSHRHTILYFHMGHPSDWNKVACQMYGSAGLVKIDTNSQALVMTLTGINNKSADIGLFHLIYLYNTNVCFCFQNCIFWKTETHQSVTCWFHLVKYAVAMWLTSMHWFICATAVSPSDGVPCNDFLKKWNYKTQTYSMSTSEKNSMFYYVEIIIMRANS